MRQIAFLVVALLLIFGVIGIIAPVHGLPVPGYYESPIGAINISAAIPDSPSSVTAYRVVPGPNDMAYYSVTDLEKIRSNVPSEADAPGVAQNILQSYGGLPPDAVLTESTVEYLIQMNGTTNTEMARYPVSTNVQYGRKINGDIPVVGDGAYINMELGDNGTLLYLNKAWRTITPDGNLDVQPVSVAIDKLKTGNVINPKKDAHDVNVTKIRLGYFERGLNQPEDYLEPAWLFRGTTESGDPIQYYVYARKFANFTSSVENISTFQPVQFTDTSETTPVQWFWDFGDGTNSTDQNPVHVYPAMGKYTVNLTAWNDIGSDTIQKVDFINVDSYDKPINADFNATPTEVSIGEPVQFNDASYSSPDAWHWEFGDGSVSDLQNPVYSYNESGNYTVNLTVSNVYGSDILSMENYIQVFPDPKPAASFESNFSLDNAQPPVVVAFNDTSTGSILRWNWDFGDGTNSTEQNPIHQFTISPDERYANYEITLEVTDIYGRNSTTSDYIYVRKGFFPDFTAEPLSGYAPLNVTFTDLTPDSEYAGYIQWDFGDGNSNQFWNQPLPRTVNNQYLEPGEYNVTLTYFEYMPETRAAMKAGGVTPNNVVRGYSYHKTKELYIVVQAPSLPAPDFTANTTSGKVPLVVNFTDQTTGLPKEWNWSFGDGSESSDSNPVHIYPEPGTYTVSLTAMNTVGLNTTTKKDYITVFPLSPPVASFTGTPLRGKAPLTVGFNDTSTGSPTSWNWDFGDGNGSTEQDPVHTYVETGNYTVSLTSLNTDGTNSTTKTDYITVTALTPPIADFRANTTSGKVPLIVAFTDNSTNSPTGWTWAFGDNTGSSSQNPVHVYAAAGTYPVSLTVTNHDGTNTTSKINYITVYPLTPPVAGFVANTTSGINPLAAAFTDKSTNSPTSWNWSFGDGALSSEQNPVHVYLMPGTFTVSLSITNSDGNDTTTKTGYITVSAPKLPVADFTANRTSGITPLAIAFTDNSTGQPTIWNWDFGDGRNSSIQNPVHQYLTAGTYSVTLSVTNQNGSNSRTRANYITVTSLPGPTANFTAQPTCGKSPLNVSFTDTSTGSPIQWKWSFGDGMNSTAQNPIHRYSSNGKYTVSLTVSNAGGSNTLTRTEYIVVSCSANPPVAKFIAAPTSGTAPLNVKFNDMSTGSPMSWYWTFGDGTNATVQNPAHLYVSAGKYTVSLTVSNAFGANTLTQKEYIMVKPIQPPCADFIGKPTYGNAPMDVVFSDTSVGLPSAWYWNFGDGTNSTAKNPVHTYLAAGIYTVSMTATNSGGTDTKIRKEYITVIGPQPTPTIKPTDTCTPKPTDTCTIKPTQTTTHEQPCESPHVTGISENSSIRLDWDAISDSRLQGYKVVISKNNPNPKYPDDGYMYWITDRFQNYSVIDSETQYNGGDVRGCLIPGQSYYFSITAIYSNAAVTGNVISLKMPGTMKSKEMIDVTTEFTRLPEEPEVIANNQSS